MNSNDLDDDCSHGYAEGMSTPIETERPFETLVTQIIDLARKRRKADDAEDQERGSTLYSVGESAQKAIENLLSPPPADKALRAALYALSQKEVWKLAAVMHSGRPGENDAITTYHKIPKDERTVLSIKGKSRLDEYLIEGLARAKRDGVDLEGDFDKAL